MLYKGYLSISCNKLISRTIENVSVSHGTELTWKICEFSLQNHRTMPKSVNIQYRAKCVIIK